VILARAKIAVALACAGALAVAAPASADYDQGYELGAEAYEYGIPLLDEDRIFRTSTSVSKTVRGNAPVNRFAHARRLADAAARTVVAPNHDTLYSLAWLDLSRRPQVIHVPRMRRFFAFELVDPWTENFRNVSTITGNRKGGDFAITGPGFDGDLPPGVKEIESEYDRVWVIGRTYIKNEADTQRVNEIQNSYRLFPLSKYGKRYKPPKIEPVDTTIDEATIPGFGPGEDPLAFYTALGALMERFPPPAADQTLLDRLRSIGVGTGLDPATDASLDAATLQGMRDAVTDGPAAIQAEIARRYVAEFGKHNGYLLGDIGRYGTDYSLRAITARVGIGALKPKIAIYAFTQTANDLTPLTGAGRYVLHIPADQLPVPARAFWSLTLYDEQVFFYDNPFGRYLINDRTDLHYNADGSLDLYVQAEQPADPAQARNWIPAPPGGFRLIWRFYDTGDARFGILDGTGWQPPKVLRCAGSGVAPDGTLCAS
jgi:hypothetical protein